MSKNSLQTGLVLSSVLLCPLEGKGNADMSQEEKPADNSLLTPSGSDKRKPTKLKDERLESA